MIEKPFSEGELVDAVASLLRGRQFIHDDGIGGVEDLGNAVVSVGDTEETASAGRGNKTR